MKQKWTRNSWLWLVVVLGLFFIASYFFQPYQQKDYPAYLTTSPSPTGVKAFYTYLERELATVKRWNRSPSKLSDQANNEVLVMIEPSVMATEDQIDAYVDFMWHGNTIMLFQRNPDELFGLTTESILYNGEKTIYDKNGDTYEAEVSYRYRLVPNIDDEILIYDNSGPIALKRSFGKGELIVSLFPDWVTNDNILKEDHIPLLLGLMNETPGKTVYFDEYSHRENITEQSYEVYPLSFLLVLFQGAILTILWLWYQGKRFGPIYVVRKETVRFGDEGIRAISAWYLRGKRYADSLVIQADYVKVLLQEQWYIPYQAKWTDISDQLAKRWTTMSKRDIDRFLVGISTVLQKGRLNKQEYLLWSKRIDRLRIEVEENE